MPNSSATHVDLKGMLPEELRALVIQLGQPAYRADQLFTWIYGKGEADINAMTDLSKQFRTELQQVARVGQLREVERQEARNGEAVKFLFALPTGECIEAVLIVDGARRTVCLSSQVGCPLDCKFCATGKMGLIGNLEAGQIVDQLLHIVHFVQARGERITNVVMMGMGEPLLNFDQVVRALHLMRLQEGAGIGGRKITVSTAGYVPGILKLAHQDLNVGLAISLNATTDTQRQQIMPINRKYKIADLLDAARQFYDLRGRRVTFEYVLLDGFNDFDQDAVRLADITREVPCKINLIPYNELGPDSLFRRPSAGRLTRFRQLLDAQANVTVTVRESRGRDIDAACGQLYQQQREKRQPRRELAATP